MGLGDCYSNRNFDVDAPPGDPNQTCGNVPHLHEVLRRVDLGIYGGASDAAMQTAHVNSLNKDLEQSFNSGEEGGIEWHPEEYTSVVIEDIDPAHANARANNPGDSSGHTRSPPPQLLLQHLHRLFDLCVATFEEILGGVVDVDVGGDAVVLEVGAVDVPQAAARGSELGAVD